VVKVIKGLTYIFVMTGLVGWMLCASTFSFIPVPKRWSVGAATAFVLVVLNLAYYLFIIVSALFYRHGREVPPEKLPTCTVVIPAYNEGRDVLKTIDSVAASDYPPEKLRVIAIDDGSADDTWEWIQRGAAKYPGRVRTLRHAVNSGKRRGLYNGFKMADSEVVVSVDSDSTITPQSLKYICGHFLNPKVGGVAGFLRVSNVNDGILPRMLDVGFVFVCDLMRASQSVFHGVFCTPGALSGYRRSALLPFLDDWVNETFMGEMAGIGEDRALSTGLLRANYHVIFENRAATYTKMPTTYGNVCKMFLRWCRGDMRETIKMYKFVFNRVNPQRLALAFNMLMQTIWVVSPFFWLLGVVLTAVYSGTLLSGIFNFSIILWATAPALLYARRNGIENAIWAYSYALFYMVFLFWLPPYSLLSIKNSDWLTRKIDPPAPPPPAVPEHN